MIIEIATAVKPQFKLRQDSDDDYVNLYKFDRRRPTADGDPSPARRSAVGCQENVKRRFQRSANQAPFSNFA
jgi:hypothetical protein